MPVDMVAEVPLTGLFLRTGCLPLPLLKHLAEKVSPTTGQTGFLDAAAEWGAVPCGLGEGEAFAFDRKTGRPRSPRSRPRITRAGNRSGRHRGPPGPRGRWWPGRRSGRRCARAGGGQLKAISCEAAEKLEQAADRPGGGAGRLFSWRFASSSGEQLVNRFDQPRNRESSVWAAHNVRAFSAASRI